MTKFIKQRIKIILALILIIISINILCLNKQKSPVATVKEETAEKAVVEVKRGSAIYLKEEEKQEKIEVAKEKGSNLVNINTKDTKPPNNVDKIEVKLLENTAIINFNKPKDNGESFNYVVKNEEEEKELNFYSEAGIYGYSYKIDNKEENEAEKQVNKLDDQPLVLENIDFSKDYFLHIRTVDKNQNFSSNKTFKIDIPSNGIKIDYIDINTNEILESSEKITGMVNDKYDIKDTEKQIPGYTLVEVEGNTEGKLERNEIDFKYKYAKNAILSINYIDEETNEKICSEKQVDTYIGKEILVDKIQVKGYTVSSKINSIKVEKEDTKVYIKYKKVGNVKVSYIDEITNEKLCDDDIKALSFGSNYKVSPKEISGYNLYKKEGEDSGIIDKENIEVKYYYKPKFEINVKYVDIDTDEVIFDEKLTSSKENKIKYKLKEIEGYKLVYDFDGENESLIDEIIKSLGKESEESLENSNKTNPLTKDERKNIKSQYEIVMNCDDSDYIIYYKKTKEI